MDMVREIAAAVAAVREKKPLVHHLTNYVTANDSANITLAFGASPVMAGDPGEAEDMAALAAALVLNIGTLSAAAVATMIAAGKRAGELGIPVVFDPVGAGATPLRTAAARQIIGEVPLAVVRGNAAEVKALAGLKAAIKGVDAVADGTDGAEAARLLAERLGCVVAVTGKIDIVVGGGEVVRIHNGHSWLSSVTGTGCMATSLVGCCCGAGAPPFAAAAAGVAAMGIAGELAFRSLGPGEGIGTFRARLFDSVFMLASDTVTQWAKVENEIWK